MDNMIITVSELYPFQQVLMFFIKLRVHSNDFFLNDWNVSLISVSYFKNKKSIIERDKMNENLNTQKLRWEKLNNLFLLNVIQMLYTLFNLIITFWLSKEIKLKHFYVYTIRPYRSTYRWNKKNFFNIIE